MATTDMPFPAGTAYPSPKRTTTRRRLEPFFYRGSPKESDMVPMKENPRIQNKAGPTRTDHSMNQRMAERVDRYGDTIHVLQSRMQDHGSSYMASYLEDLALRTERMSDQLRRGAYRDAAREMRRFATDHPELFLGTLFAGGLVAGRVIGDTVRRRGKEDLRLEIVHEPTEPVVATGTHRPSEPTAHILHEGG